MKIKFINFLIKSKFNIKKAKKYKENYNLISESGLFDKNFYLTTYPHVADSGMDPLFHYLFYGSKEGKSPNKFLYLTNNSNIENPLIEHIKSDSKNLVLPENYFEIKKKEIINTNRLFLSNNKIDKEPLVSIIILNRNGLHHLKRLFIDFDKNTNYSNYEIIVVDNNSTDESINYLKSLDLKINIIKNKENLSFSKCNNDAVKIANGEYVLFLNNDIEPTFGWLKEMVITMLSNKNIGAVGAKLIFPLYKDYINQPKSFSIQHAGVKFREEITPYIYGPYHEHIYCTLINNHNVNKIKEVISNTAACLLVNKKIYLDLKGLDENYFYGYEDIDFAFKLIENGYKSIYCPHALLFHHESATRKKDDKTDLLNYKNIMYFRSKWENKLKKAILLDKIHNKHFITNKKLYIYLINNGKINFIKEITKILIEKKYIVHIINETEIIDKDCDVLISFNKEFDMSNIYARENLIKLVKDTKSSPDIFVKELINELENYYVG